MKRLVISALALAMAATALPAMAQTWRSENREFRQDQRIYRGAVTGRLTPGEYARLQKQQWRIDRAQRAAARDGVVTRAERRQIERMQNRASRNIARKNSNYRNW